MSDMKTTKLAIKLYVEASVLERMFQEGKLSEFTVGSHVGEPAVAEGTLTIEKSWIAVRVSRPSERLVAYTGPCEEPDCDGYHVVGFLPPEPDHGPDDWVAGLSEIRWDGGSLRPEDARELLAGAGPKERVDSVLQLLDKMGLPA